MGFFEGFADLMEGFGCGAPLTQLGNKVGEIRNPLQELTDLLKPLRVVAKTQDFPLAFANLFGVEQGETEPLFQEPGAHPGLAEVEKMIEGSFLSAIPEVLEDLKILEGSGIEGKGVRFEKGFKRREMLQLNPLGVCKKTGDEICARFKEIAFGRRGEKAMRNPFSLELFRKGCALLRDQFNAGVVQEIGEGILPAEDTVGGCTCDKVVAKEPDPISSHQIDPYPGFELALGIIPFAEKGGSRGKDAGNPPKEGT
jgi:hypothetical protein